MKLEPSEKIWNRLSLMFLCRKILVTYLLKMAYVVWVLSIEGSPSLENKIPLMEDTSWICTLKLRNQCQWLNKNT